MLHMNPINDFFLCIKLNTGTGYMFKSLKREKNEEYKAVFYLKYKLLVNEQTFLFTIIQIIREIS